MLAVAVRTVGAVIRDTQCSLFFLVNNTVISLKCLVNGKTRLTYSILFFKDEKFIEMYTLVEMTLVSIFPSKLLIHEYVHIVQG